MKGVPSSIYRLQLTAQFTIEDATKLIPYLRDLGIDGIYCSPYFAAHSPHGYDITDPNQLNPLVTSSEQHDAFCSEMKRFGMKHIIDVVPNHMGILGKNLWWKDVLKRGKLSKYASFFDIYWKEDKILLPFLGTPYAEELMRDPHPYCRLVHWKHSAEEAGYRRFFNINELIGLRMEDEEVMRAHHKLVFRLLKEGKVDGLRIDHPDGLYDPEGYFDRLRETHKGLIVVEKILGFDEELPGSWQVDGTVGYEFMNLLAGLFVKPEPQLTEIYESFIGHTQDFDEMLYSNKISFMKNEMAGDVKQLAALLSIEGIESALYALLASFPIYRTYIRPRGSVSKRDQVYIEQAFARARKAVGSLPALERLKQLFTLKEDTEEIREFLLRFQQLSAPVMAKGFEDITLYQYNRLIALNDVGSEPTRLGISPKEFHAFCVKKQEHFPLGFLTTSTHDTKRSFDVRMQIACLSEIPERWRKALQSFAKVNEEHKTRVGSELFPDRNAEILLYQTLLGVWPSKPTFSRLWTCFEKSLREARTYTNWSDPCIEYERAAKRFLRAILKKGSPFMNLFLPLQKEIQERGEWKSLSATALKLGAPGIVDVYEGCEHLRYTLVDPDNRSPVHYRRAPTLKSRLHQIALNLRLEHKALFLEGDYHPVRVRGPHADSLVAYLRTHKGKTLLVAGMCHMDKCKALKENHLELPKTMGEGDHLFLDRTLSGKVLSAAELFEEAPFAWVFWASGDSPRSR